MLSGDSFRSDEASRPRWNITETAQRSWLRSVLGRGAGVPGVKDLLTLDNSVDALTARDRFNRTSLHIAAEYGWDQAITLLIESGSSRGAKSDTGETPLHLAVKSRVDLPALELLCNGPATVGKSGGVGDRHDVLNSRDDLGCTALHVAALVRNAPAAFVLSRCGVDPFIVNEEGKSALDLAHERQCGEIVFLVERALAWHYASVVLAAMAGAACQQAVYLRRRRVSFNISAHALTAKARQLPSVRLDSEFSSIPSVDGTFPDAASLSRHSNTSSTSTTLRLAPAVIAGLLSD